MSTTQLVPSTERSRLCRTRQKIDAIIEECSWFTRAVELYWIGYDLPISTWATATDFYNGIITDAELGVREFFPDYEIFLRYLKSDRGIERATLRQGMADVLLIRQRFLNDELNPQ